MTGTRPGRVRKTLRLTQSTLDRARRILGAATETETLERALHRFRDAVAGPVVVAEPGVPTSTAPRSRSLRWASSR